MTSRYDRVDPMVLYQQQKSHYQHIYNARATLKLDTVPRKTVSLHRPNKTEQIKDRQRTIQNRKMLRSLLDIYNNKPGILSKQYEFFCPKSSASQKRRTFYSTYKKQQQDLKKQNHDILHHIVKVEPSVGTQKQWSKHYEQHLSMEKKLRSHQNKDIFNLKQFREQLTRDKRRRLSRFEKKEELLKSQQGRSNRTSLRKSEHKKKTKKKKEKQTLQLEEKSWNVAQIETVPN